MAIAPVNGSSSSAQNAFGLEFQSLLRIILTQLTYQDPLKPMDNFQFVSQLGQFAQLQNSQSLNDKVNDLLSAQSTTQATSLLGKTVDIGSGAQIISGKVESVSFASGTPTVTLATSTGQTIPGLSISNIVQVR